MTWTTPWSLEAEERTSTSPFAFETLSISNTGKDARNRPLPLDPCAQRPLPLDL